MSHSPFFSSASQPWSFVNHELLQASKAIFDSYTQEALDWIKRSQQSDPELRRFWSCLAVQLNEGQTSSGGQHKATRENGLSLLFEDAIVQAKHLCEATQGSALEPLRQETVCFLYRKCIETQTYLEPSTDLALTFEAFRDWVEAQSGERETQAQEALTNSPRAFEGRESRLCSAARLEWLRSHRCLVFYHCVHQHWDEALGALQELMAYFLLPPSEEALTHKEEDTTLSQAFHEANLMAIELNIALVPFLEGICSKEDYWPVLFHLEALFQLIRLYWDELELEALFMGEWHLHCKLLTVAQTQPALWSKAYSLLNQLNRNFTALPHANLKMMQQLLNAFTGMVPVLEAMQDEPWPQQWSLWEQAAHYMEHWNFEPGLCSDMLRLSQALLPSLENHHQTEALASLLENAMLLTLHHVEQVEVVHTFIQLADDLAPRLRHMERPELLIQLADFLLLLNRLSHNAQEALIQPVLTLAYAKTLQAWHGLLVDFGTGALPQCPPERLLRGLIRKVEAYQLLSKLEPVLNHHGPGFQAEAWPCWQEPMWSHRLAQQPKLFPQKAIELRLAKLLEANPNAKSLREVLANVYVEALEGALEQDTPKALTYWSALYQLWLDCPKLETLSLCLSCCAEGLLDKVTEASQALHLVEVLLSVAKCLGSLNSIESLESGLRLFIDRFGEQEAFLLPLLKSQQEWALSLNDPLELPPEQEPTDWASRERLSAALHSMQALGKLETLLTMLTKGRLHKAEAIYHELRQLWVMFPDHCGLAETIAKASHAMLLAEGKDLKDGVALASQATEQARREAKEAAKQKCEVLYWHTLATAQKRHAHLPRLQATWRHMLSYKLQTLLKQQDYSEAKACLLELEAACLPWLETSHSQNHDAATVLGLAWAAMALQATLCQVPNASEAWVVYALRRLSAHEESLKGKPLYCASHTLALVAGPCLLAYQQQQDKAGLKALYKKLYALFATSLVAVELKHHTKQQQALVQALLTLELHWTLFIDAPKPQLGGWFAPVINGLLSWLQPTTQEAMQTVRQVCQNWILHFGLGRGQLLGQGVTLPQMVLWLEQQAKLHTVLVEGFMAYSQWCLLLQGLEQAYRQHQEAEPIKLTVQSAKGQSAASAEETVTYKAVPLFSGEVSTLPLTVRSLSPEGSVNKTEVTTDR